MPSNKINTVCDLFFEKLVHEVFNEFSSESSMQLLNFGKSWNFNEKQGGTRKGSSLLLMQEMQR